MENTFRRGKIISLSQINRLRFIVHHMVSHEILSIC